MATDRLKEIALRMGADLNEFVRRVDITAANGYLRFTHLNDPTRHVEIETDSSRGTKVFVHRANGVITGSGPYCELDKALDVAAAYVREMFVD